MAAAAITRMPTLFVTHGGGPLPVLGDPSHVQVTKWLKEAHKLLPSKPTAIVSVTGHWEGRVTTVSTSPQPPMLYDYGGFPPESYTLQYPAPGDPALAKRLAELLKRAGLGVAEDSRRGYDHGTFIPLMLMFPQADIPVVQVSLVSSMDPATHLAVGRALAPLREEGVLIMGSGSSVHNMGVFMRAMGGGALPADVQQKARAWDDWLAHACCELRGGAREAELKDWEAKGPHGRFWHPREEHLIPLHVVAGAAGADAKATAHRMECLKLPATNILFE
eukprot:CAMPEP_0202858186 /NCGR_PEP_ID=MMETSP1391-20130828/825_1 /ASSEMBLY_ACC=CAM_ASM_000867 /TAXON_ID=1034604 /ORGANISM="Chlamydomonas leiostraca, Strain SAG 11-49" /LENGTH=276 /DNA_ID=CAMNT_0049537073 /DNA_START=119 /DNA_END=949 /DNA_ORIENTATION=-